MRVEDESFPLFMNPAFVLWEGGWHPPATDGVWVPRIIHVRSPSLPTPIPATAASSNPVAQAVCISLHPRSLPIVPFQSYPVSIPVQK